MVHLPELKAVMLAAVAEEVVVAAVAEYRPLDLPVLLALQEGMETTANQVAPAIPDPMHHPLLHSNSTNLASIANRLNLVHPDPQGLLVLMASLELPDKTLMEEAEDHLDPADPQDRQEMTVNQADQDNQGRPARFTMFPVEKGHQDHPVLLEMTVNQAVPDNQEAMANQDPPDLPVMEDPMDHQDHPEEMASQDRLETKEPKEPVTTVLHRELLLDIKWREFLRAHSFWNKIESVFASSTTKTLFWFAFVVNIRANKSL